MPEIASKRNNIFPIIVCGVMSPNPTVVKTVIVQ
jgi:hypothetical protein